MSKVNPKALKERKALLNKQVDELEIELETRAWSDEEQAKVDQLQKEISQITATLEKLTEQVFTKEDKTEEPQMDQTNTEIRSLLQSANGGVMKQNTFANLFESVEKQDDVLALMETVSNDGETLNFVIEDSTAMLAQAVAEGIEVSEVAPILKNIELKPTRKGALLPLSKEFLNGLGNASYENHVQDLLVKAVNRKRQLDMVNAIKSNANVEKITSATVGTIAIEDVAELILSAPEGSYAILGHKTTIRGLKRMKDANGQFYVQNGEVNGKLTSTFMGLPLKEVVGFDTPASGKIGLALVGQGAVKEVINANGVEIEKVLGENVKQGIKMYNVDYLNDIEVVEEDFVKLLKIQ